MSSLSQQLFGSIRHLGVKRKVHKSDLLFFAGDIATGFYYIESGEIRLYQTNEQGRTLELRRLHESDFLAEITLFASPVYPVNAEVSRVSQLYYFEKQRLLNAIDQDPGLAKLFMTLFAQKCMALNQALESFALSTVRQRLIQFLRNNCQKAGNCDILLPVKKSELAQQLGTISATLSRNLLQLEKERLIQVNGRSIHILDCNRLYSGI